MNKLVSKNPVLRFKEGKKIVKAYGGTRFVEAGRSTIGNKIWADTTTGDLYELNLDPNNSKYVNKLKPGMKGHLGKTTNYYNLFTGRGTINGSDYIHKNPVRNTKSTILQILSGPGSTKAGMEAEYKATHPELTLKSIPVVKRTTSRNGWSYGYNRSNEISDIKATQQMLKDAGYLSSDKYNVVDGKWGNDTENAYKKYLLNKEKPVVAPTQEEILQVLSLIAQQAQPTLVTQTLLNLTPELSNFTPQPVTRTFNKSEIRDFIRSKGRGAYDYTGAQRKALRMIMNGLGTDEDRAIVQGMNLFKQGGQLVSRNPINRFKNKKK